ncbi:MAG TPA: ribbon-helix-helix protein, CopG family [Candidatus Acidoferrales bacterium]|nr:ribbon-helix-helix protein, CopG family [Candidatus Acidoferrales bacterium]
MSSQHGGAVLLKKGKRLSLNLSDHVYDELTQLAAQRQSSMTEIVRLALGLVRIAISESEKGNKLVITSANGDALKEIVLPR